MYVLYIHFQDRCSAVTRSGIGAFWPFLAMGHQSGTLYTRSHALQKPSQSVCAFGLISWSFMVKICALFCTYRITRFKFFVNFRDCVTHRTHKSCDVVELDV